MPPNMEKLSQNNEINVTDLITEIIEVAQSNNKKSELVSKIIGKFLEDFTKTIRELEGSKKEAATAAADAAIASNELNAKLRNLTVEQRTEIEKLSAEVKKITEQVHEKQRIATENIRVYTEKVEKLERQCDDLGGLCEGKQNELVERTQKINELTDDLRTMTLSSDNVVKDRNRISKELSDTIAKNKTELASLRAEIDNAMDADDDRESELTKAKNTVDQLSNAIEDLKRDNLKIVGENTTLLSEKGQLNAQMTEVDAKTAELMRNVESAELAAKTAEATMNSEKEKCSQMEAEIRRLKSALAPMTNSELNLNKIIEQLNKHSSNFEDSSENNSLLKELSEAAAVIDNVGPPPTTPPETPPETPHSPESPTPVPMLPLQQVQQLHRGISTSGDFAGKGDLMLNKNALEDAGRQATARREAHEKMAEKGAVGKTADLTPMEKVRERIMAEDAKRKAAAKLAKTAVEMAKPARSGGRKTTRKKKNKKKRNSTKRIVFKTKKLNKKTRIKKVKKMNKKPAKKLTRKRK